MVESTLPVQVLLGVYLGVLTGIIPALVTWGFAVVFRYVTGLTVPSFAVVVLGVAMAGVNGGFMAFNDPTLLQSANSTTLLTAVLVVMMAAFYTHNLGDKLGSTLPRHLSLRSLRERSLSADVVELVGGRGQVRVRVVGAVEDMEGYPPLPPDLRGRIRESDWRFPADLPLDELEVRVADRLREEFDLAAVDVDLDERARATVTAAPPHSGVSRRVPAAHRAVSFEAVVPTGVARGDEVLVVAGDRTAEGAFVAGEPAPPPESEGPDEPAATDGETPPSPPAPRAETTAGGEGRVTVAVPRADADALLRASAPKLVVTSRGVRREFELVSVLRRAGQRIRRLTVREGGPLDGATIGEANVREAYGVAILAVRGDGWTFAPRGEAELGAGDDLFVAGTPDAVESFREAVA